MSPEPVASTGAADASVPISVVVGTTHPWPELQMTLASLETQVAELGAELIVLDRDGRGIPEDFATRFPRGMAMSVPGASVFQMRAIGVTRARGEIVAVTEDHCRLPPDWLATLVETHRRHPEAGAVGGAVENGPTPDGLIDWANFFIAHVPLMPPIPGGESDVISTQAGMAFKRRALPRDPMPLGLMEWLVLPELRRRGEKLFARADLIVEHAQSHGFWNTFAVHFHNGRSIAGFRRVDMSAAELVWRLASRPAVPAILTLRAAAAVMRKRRFVGTFFRALPLVVALACCHTAGEIAGFLAGPGRSPQRIP